MLCKWSCILLMVATLFVLATGDCIKDAIESASAGGQGGYRKIKNPKKNPVVKKVVADSIKLKNKKLPPAFRARYVDADHYVAYSQLVSGENYCCRFQIKKKCGGKRAKCPPEKLVCDVEAYKAFSAKFATINEASLNCTKPKRG